MRSAQKYFSFILGVDFLFKIATLRTHGVRKSSVDLELNLEIKNDSDSRGYILYEFA